MAAKNILSLELLLLRGHFPRRKREASGNEAAIDPRCLLKWLSFKPILHAPLGSFTWFKKMITRDNEFHDHVMGEPLLLGKLLHTLFASLLSFALSTKIQSKICGRKEFDRCKIHYSDEIKFASNLVLLRNLQKLCCKLAIHAKRCLSSCDHFFNHVNETNGGWWTRAWKKKSYFNRCLGSQESFRWQILSDLNVWSWIYYQLETAHNNLKRC